MQSKKKYTAYNSRVIFTFHSLRIPQSTSDLFNIEWKCNKIKGNTEYFFANDLVVNVNREYSVDFILTELKSNVYKDKNLDIKITRQKKTYIKYKINITDYLDKPMNQQVLELQGPHKHPSFLTLSIHVMKLSDRGLEISSQVSEQTGMTHESMDNYCLSEENDAEDKKRHEVYFSSITPVKTEFMRRSNSKSKLKASQDLFMKCPSKLSLGDRSKSLSGFLIENSIQDALNAGKRLNDTITDIFTYQWGKSDPKFKHPMAVITYKAFLEYNYLSMDSTIFDHKTALKTFSDLIGINTQIDFNEKLSVVIDLVVLIIMDPNFDCVSTRPWNVVLELLNIGAQLIKNLDCYETNADMINNIVDSILYADENNQSNIGQTIKKFIKSVEDSNKYYVIFLPLIKQSLMHGLDASLVNSLIDEHCDCTFFNTCRWKSVITDIRGEGVDLPMFSTALNFMQLPFFSMFDKDDPLAIFDELDSGCITKPVIHKLLSLLKEDGQDRIPHFLDFKDYFSNLASNEVFISAPEYRPDYTNIIKIFKQKDTDESAFNKNVVETFKFFKKHF